MLENVLARDYRDVKGLNVTQDLLPLSEYRQVSVISFAPKDTSNVKKIVVCAPGYPGDFTGVFYELGQRLVEEGGEDVATCVIGYPGVLRPVLESNLDAEVSEPDGAFSFLTAANSLKLVLQSLNQQFPDAHVYLVGHSYGATFALGHLVDQRLKGMFLINPVTDVGMLMDPTNFDILGLLNYGIKYQDGVLRIRGNTMLMHNQLKDLATRYNPLDERIRIATIPVYICRGEKDRDLSIDHVAGLASTLAKAGARFEFVPFKLGDHNFSNEKAEDDLIKYIGSYVLSS